MSASRGNGQLAMGNKGKVGAVNWTIGKLINIVLAVIVLVLVVYGVSSGIIPGMDKMGAKFNQVIDGLKAEGGERDYLCYQDSIDSYVGGDDFLESIGFEGRDVKVGRCGPICNMTGGGVVSQRVNGELDETFVGGSWRVRNDLFVRDADSIERNWEIYHGAISALKAAGVNPIFLSSKDSVRFVMYGDSSTTFAFWQNNWWTIYEEKDDDKGIIYSGSDDDIAFENFFDATTGWFQFNDKVSWRLLGEGEVYSKADRGVSVGKINADKLEKLKTDFLTDVKARVLSQLYPSDEDVDKLRRDVEHVAFSVGDEIFEMDVRMAKDGFFIKLSPDVELEYSPHGKKLSDFSRAALDPSPFVLVSWDGNLRAATDEGYYKLSKENFKEVQEATLISGFLKSICR